MLLLNDYIIIRRRFLIFLLLCLGPFAFSKAQISTAGKYLKDTIKGIVIDSATKTVLSHVTVSIRGALSDQPLETTSTNSEGNFELSILHKKSYQLELSHIGYNTLVLQIPTFTATSLHLGAVSLTSLTKQLSEIQVATQRPLLEQSLDKLVYFVDADPDSKTASALDILRKIPLVSLDADDNLQLNGNSNYRVLINGKSSSLFLSNQSDMFKNLSASAIKTIEVITVPPSKYEATGVGGIINIITYKRNLGGYNGGINVRVSDPRGVSANGNLSLKMGKFSFSANLAHSNSTNPANSSHFIRKDKLRYSRLEQTGSNNSHNRSQNGGGEMSFELNERNLFTMGYSANSGSSTNRYTQLVTMFNLFNEPAEAYRRLSEGGNNQHGNDLVVDYQRNFKKNAKQQLTFSYKRSYNTSDYHNYFTQQPLMAYKRRASITNNVDQFNEHTFQADYVQPIQNHTLELGGSTTRRQNTSAYFYKDQDTAMGAFILDSTQSNSFSYQEAIDAGYTSLNLHLGKWGVKMGARLERARIDAHFNASNTEAVQEYKNLIPSLTLSRQLKSKSVLRLSYAQRLQRPSLFYLDPYVDRTDPWNISYGNPALKPALAHVFNLAYNTFLKKTAININAYHQFTNNSIQQFTRLDADTIAHSTYGNIGRNGNTSLSLALNSTFFKMLGVSLNSNVNYIAYSRINNGKTSTHEGLTYSTTGSAHLRLKTWRLGGNMSYNAPNVLAQGRTAAYTANSATLNKYFLKNNQANIGFSVTSLFREHRRSFTEIDEPSFYLWRESRSVIRRYNLSFNYRFVKVQGSSENVRREK